jgi:ribosomal protein S6--L-glutamate ligase
MAINAAKALHVEIAGVDLIETDDGLYVIEVNASPGFRGLQKATGIDVAREIVEYAVQKSQR